MSEQWSSGNAVADGAATRGWWVGPYVQPPRSMRATRDVEIKWGVHAAGEERPAGWADEDDQHTVTVLVSGGPFRVDLPGNAHVVLARAGDFVMWKPGTRHCWQALGDAVLLVIRWRGRDDEEPPAPEPVEELAWRLRETYTADDCDHLAELLLR